MGMLFMRVIMEWWSSFTKTCYTHECCNSSERSQGSGRMACICTSSFWHICQTTSQTKCWYCWTAKKKQRENNQLLFCSFMQVEEPDFLTDGCLKRTYMLFFFFFFFEPYICTTQHTACSLVSWQLNTNLGQNFVWLQNLPQWNWQNSVAFIPAALHRG